MSRVLFRVSVGVLDYIAFRTSAAAYTVQAKHHLTASFYVLNDVRAAGDTPYDLTIEGDRL